jgi:allantoinase
LELAKLTGCALHIVHVSSAAGLELIDAARQAGIDVTAETCPHYLLLDDDDLFRLGPVAKCAPPLRPTAEKEKLWNALKEGKVQTIGSDHSPSPPELKTSRNFFEVWGGIAGCQHSYLLFFEEALLHRQIEPSLVARLTALQVAERFRLANKGDLRVGWDADITLLGIGPAREIEATDLLTKHPISPYVGRSTKARVVTTIARGQTTYGPGLTKPRDPARILRPTPL